MIFAGPHRSMAAASSSWAHVAQHNFLVNFARTGAHCLLFSSSTMSSNDEMEFPDGSDAAAAGAGGDEVDEAALEAMKARVAEMEAEAAKLREMQEQANNGMGSGDAGASQAAALSEEEKEEVDGRSVYVGNVSVGRGVGTAEQRH